MGLTTTPTNAVAATPPGANAAALKRVLLVNPWSTCHGGTSMVLLEFVKHLDRSRFDPIVLCPTEGELPQRLRELEAPHLVHSLSGLSRQSWLQFFKDAYWYVRFLRRERIDVVHLNGPKWRSSIAWAARIRSVPLIVHVHNPVRHAEKNFTLRWAQRIVPVSDAVGEALWQSESLSKKTVTIHNGVELDLFLPDGENNRAEIGAADDSFVVGFVGQLVPRKGLLCLIRALQRVVRREPKVKLVVVGCSPPDDEVYEQECRHLAKELDVAGHIQFVGFRRDIERWMRSFDLFVLPTKSEPFGKVIIEAMAARCPVVASRVGGIPEIIRSPEYGTLVPPDDPDALAKAMLSMIEDAPLREQIAQAGCHLAREKFGMDSMINRLQDAYSELLSPTL